MNLIQHRDPYLHVGAHGPCRPDVFLKRPPCLKMNVSGPSTYSVIKTLLKIKLSITGASLSLGLGVLSQNGKTR